MPLSTLATPVPPAPPPDAGAPVALRVLVPAGPSGRSALTATLTAAGLATLVVPPADLIGQALRGGVDLVLLPLDPPDAAAQLAALRATCLVPIVLLLRSGQVSPTALERYLLIGADDCVPRGVSGAELAARLRGVLRRRIGSGTGEVLRLGPFVLDVGRHLCTARGAAVHLPPKEFGLLELLMRRDGRVVGRQEALDLVWATRTGRTGGRVDGGCDPTTVDVHVKRLRSRLEVDPAAPRHLLTVRGLGYRLVG